MSSTPSHNARQPALCTSGSVPSSATCRERSPRYTNAPCAAEGTPSNSARASVSMMSSARALLLKKLSSVPKKYAQSVLFVQLPHLLGDACGDFRRCCRWLYAGIGQYGQANLQPKVSTSELIGAVPANAIGRQCAWSQCRRPARRLRAADSRGPVRQFIQIADQPLHAGVDQFLDDAVALAARIDQARDAVQGTANLWPGRKPIASIRQCRGRTASLRAG